MSPLTLSVASACSLLGLSRSTIYKLISDHRLDTIKIGTRTLITMESLKALVANADEVAE